MLDRLLAPARRRAGIAALAAGLGLLATGCGPDYKSRGVVRGKVTAGDKSLTVGTVMFYGQNGLTASASINKDGIYVLSDAPVGECTVTVTVPDSLRDPSGSGRGKGKGPKMPSGPRPPAGVEMPEGALKYETEEGEDAPGAAFPKEIVPIEAKYSKPDSSGLTYTVRKGEEQTFDIALPPGPAPAKGPKMPRR